MRTTWDNIVQPVGTIHGHDIINELHNNKTVIIPRPEHTQDVLDEHQLATKRRYQSYQKLEEARQFQKRILEDQIIDGETNIVAKANMDIAVLNNEIAEDEYKIQHILPIVLKGDTRVEHEN